jgi:hypothetical protein
MADIIDGKAFAAKIRAEVKEDADMSAKNLKWPLSAISKPKISN